MGIIENIGLGTISLVIYILSIIILNVLCKRKMAESMTWSVLLLLVIGLVTGNNVKKLAVEGINFAIKQETLFAALSFVFMAYLMSTTGVIERLVKILNSFLGKLAGGPAYVSTIASALFGMVSGSGSGNASAVGSITIPWMRETGWSKEDAAIIVAGNAGLGIAFPPSSSMFLLLGMPAIAAELTSSELYGPLFIAATYLLISRLILVFIYVKKKGIKAVPNDLIMPIGKALKENGLSLSIFLGVIIPLLVTMGPISRFLTAQESFGASGLKSISMLVWIPVLMSVITIIEGWKRLPHSIKGWFEYVKKGIGKYSEVGVLLFAAFIASRILILLGLQSEITAIMEVLAGHSKLLVILIIALLISMMVGPFSGTATTTAVGSIAYIAFRSIGISPAVACSAFLILSSNEGCMPPSSAPLYIASGIADVERPGSIFKITVLHFGIPAIIIGILIALGILPIFS